MITKILEALRNLFRRKEEPIEPIDMSYKPLWLTKTQFQEAMGISDEKVETWYYPIRSAALEYRIVTRKQIAAFLAQIGHETQGLVFVREIWGPTATQAGYEGRADLGNVYKGDGFKYRGRGLIHTTGRYNHRVLTQRLRARFGPSVPDFEENPTLLEMPQWAAMSAGDYWDMKDINPAADAGDFELVTRKVNGGLNGYKDRVERHHLAQNALA